MIHKSLHDHFYGEVNEMRNIAEEKCIHETIHLQNEIAMSFETFLTKYQMNNIHKK